MKKAVTGQAKTTAKRPSSRGYYIDFKPRKKKVVDMESLPESVINTNTIIDVYAQHPPVGRKEDELLTTVEEYHNEMTTNQIEQDAPDANKYVIGGESPFLKSVSVSKRPLSTASPDKTTPGTKNIYHKEAPKSKPKPSQDEFIDIVDEPKKMGNAGLVVVIIITILLGAAAGAAAYYFMPM